MQRFTHLMRRRFFHRFRPLLPGLLALLVCAACATAKPATTAAPPHRENPDILWHFIHDRCMPTATQGIYPPAPCTAVVDAEHPSRGYAVFKDRAGRYQYLVLPLARITGIESPKLLRPDAPNYLADAWLARMYTEAALGRPVPREDIALVVNSAHGRSQNQLHIHVDCVKPSVREALQHALPHLTRTWNMLPMRLPDAHGRRYIARWVEGKRLTINPFAALAGHLGDKDQMQWHSLVVAGARRVDGTPGFILLSTRAEADATPENHKNNGNSDNLHDRSCAIARPDPKK
ncbi:CDP-diacylglycerol diphosphatase [Oleiagrimonas citrea]